MNEFSLVLLSYHASRNVARTGIPSICDIPPSSLRLRQVLPEIQLQMMQQIIGYVGLYLNESKIPRPSGLNGLDTVALNIPLLPGLLP